MHPDETDKDYDTISKGYGHKVPTELFRDWAKESAELLCTEVYAPMTVNHADGTRIDSPFTLTEELFEKWTKLAKAQMALGGERLAFVLNDLIEHKRHKDAHKDGRALPSVKLAIGTEPAGPPSPSAANVAATVAGPSSGSSVSNTQKVTSNGKAAAAPVDFAPLVKQLQILERRRSRADATYNLCIAVVLVPGLLVTFNWHRGIGGGNILGLAKHLKM